MAERLATDVGQGAARAALLTISSSKARGEGQDTSSIRMAALAGRLGLEIAAQEVLPDDRAETRVSGSDGTRTRDLRPPRLGNV
jgi:molybdopterin biosynthesis enzyme MoaB